MHPYQKHREHHIKRERVHELYGHHEGHRDYEHTYYRARGGKVGHGDEAEDRAVVRSMVKGEALKHGHRSHSRADKRARGGKVKHKGKTVVNVNVAPQQSAPHPMPVPMPPPGANAAPVPQPRPPIPAPGGAPGMPPGMPPRARGGRIAGFATGGPVEPHFKAGVGMGPSGHGAAKGKKVSLPKNAIYAPSKGDMAPTSGTGTGGGVARMELAHRARKVYAKTPPAIHTPGMRND